MPRSTPPIPSEHPVVIQPLLAVGGADRVSESLDAIFFESSSVRAFADEAARAQFRERWLGRYLGADAGLAFVACTPRAPRPAAGSLPRTAAATNTAAGPDCAGSIIGYVVGTLDDPARSGRFDDIAHFAELAAHTPRYPAHLHINVAASHRGGGIGRALIEAFADAARETGARGVHVVTGEGMRNVRFYSAAGFQLVATAGPEGKRVVMLGRDLAAPCNESRVSGVVARY